MEFGRKEEKGRREDTIHEDWLQGESSTYSQRIFLSRKSAVQSSLLTVLLLEEHFTSFPTLSSVLIQLQNVPAQEGEGGQEEGPIHPSWSSSDGKDEWARRQPSQVEK